MTRPPTVWSQGSEFDAFLFASIGEEKNGMLLSVVSALARLDLDPWREAAQLTRMSTAAANQRLTSLIEGLPQAPSMRPEPRMIAARLIALLPREPRRLTVASKTLPGAGAALNPRTLILIVLVILLFMIAMTGAQWAAASLHPSANIDSARPSTATAVFPEESLRASNR